MGESRTRVSGVGESSAKGYAMIHVAVRVVINNNRTDRDIGICLCSAVAEFSFELTLR